MAVLQNFGHFLNFTGGKVKNRNTRLASPQVKVYFLRTRIFKLSASAKCRGGRVNNCEKIEDVMYTVFIWMIVRWIIVHLS